MTKQLPDGIEWPRFEDGELVQYRDQIMHEGRPETVQAFYFNWPGHVILSLAGVDHEKFHHLFDGATVQRPPVLDKDGKEIKVGDTVWDDFGNELTVAGFTWSANCQVQTLDNEQFVDIYTPEQLTRTPPDSWEKLREDARKVVHVYWGCFDASCDDCPVKVDGKNPMRRYHTTTCGDAMRLDILARAEKLAGVSADD